MGGVKEPPLGHGGAGDDSITGGNGGDRLFGGIGRDKFNFSAISDSCASGRDTIYDFVGSEGDRIDLSKIDANSKTAGDRSFSFIETAAFRGKPGELRYEKASSDTYIYADVNGDRKADFVIHLDDPATLHKDFFIL